MQQTVQLYLLTCQDGYLIIFIDIRKGGNSKKDLHIQSSCCIISKGRILQGNWLSKNKTKKTLKAGQILQNTDMNSEPSLAKITRQRDNKRYQKRTLQKTGESYLQLLVILPNILIVVLPDGEGGEEKQPWEHQLQLNSAAGYIKDKFSPI